MVVRAFCAVYHNRVIALHAAFFSVTLMFASLTLLLFHLSLSLFRFVLILIITLTDFDLRELKLLCFFSAKVTDLVTFLEAGCILTQYY